MGLAVTVNHSRVLPFPYLLRTGERTSHSPRAALVNLYGNCCRRTPRVLACGVLSLSNDRLELRVTDTALVAQGHMQFEPPRYHRHASLANGGASVI